VPVDWLVFLAIAGMMILIISTGIGLSIVRSGSHLPWSAVPAGTRLAMRIGLALIGFSLFVHFCGWFEIVNVPGGMDASWLPPAAPEDGPSPAERVEELEDAALDLLPEPLRGVLIVLVYLLAQVLPRLPLMKKPLFAFHHGGTPWTAADVVVLGCGTAVVLLLLVDGVWRYARVARARSTGSGARS
jgi:hypothetical protein